MNSRVPGAFRKFQSVYFTSSEDSDLEDGRGPKRKIVRLDTDASMPNAAQSESDGMEVTTWLFLLSIVLFLSLL